MTRWLICHNEMGIYLGSWLGLGFFSLLDSGDQTVAVTFPNVDEARSYIATWDNQPEGLWYIPVEPSEGIYATPSDITRAGVGHLLGDVKTNALKHTTPAGHA